MECELRVNDRDVDAPAKLWRLREMTREYPEVVGPIWARLMIDHWYALVRHHALDFICDAPNKQLRTPAVRQVVWDAGVADPFMTFEVERSLQLFGRDQLQPIPNDEFIRQLAAVCAGRYCSSSDDILELYLRELIRRKIEPFEGTFDPATLTDVPLRRLMIRTAWCRSRGKPDPITFKVTRSGDDPRLVSVELALTDTSVDRFELVTPRHPNFYILATLKDPDGTSKPWMEKWPDRLTLEPGKPIRTAFSTALIREGHQVEVTMPGFPINYRSSPNRDLLPGPPLLEFSQTIDMPALP